MPAQSGQQIEPSRPDRPQHREPGAHSGCEPAAEQAAEARVMHTPSTQIPSWPATAGQSASQVHGPPGDAPVGGGSGASGGASAASGISSGGTSSSSSPPAGSTEEGPQAARSRQASRRTVRMGAHDTRVARRVKRRRMRGGGGAEPWRRRLY